LLGFGNDANQAAIVAADIIPLLVELLRGGSNEGRAKAARALLSSMIGNDNFVTAIVAAGVLPGW
jgi:hypothetical protein